MSWARRLWVGLALTRTSHYAVSFRGIQRQARPVPDDTDKSTEQQDEVNALVKEAEYHDFDDESSFRAGDYGEARRAERRAEDAWRRVEVLSATQSADAASADEAPIAPAARRGLFQWLRSKFLS